jgi:RNA polymerase sigma-70 factor (ECF subfamily)
MDNVQHEVDRLYKSHFGKMVSTLLYFSRDIDLDTAEDLVQDSFSAALVSWRKDGVPANPAGWIFTVCKNKALNKIKDGKRFRNLFQEEATPPRDAAILPSAFDDYQLRLLFACAHPHLSPKVQVVITLKYVINLKVEAIAKILAMTIDGVDKLLIRARQKIREEKILFEEAGGEAIQSRIAIVHKLIYLIFNEGYKTSWGKELIREELCEEALLLDRALLNSRVGNQETAALYALMLFNAARFKARFGPSGELLDLEEQDRSLWDGDLIRLACHYLDQSRGGPASPYHYEAAIAYLHCTAKSFAATNWPAITGLYRQLLDLHPNPFVELNYAIALYYAGGKAKAFDMLNGLLQHPFLSQYYLLNAALGKLHFLEGDLAAAKRFWENTLRQTSSPAEKDFIRKMIDKAARPTQ